MIKAVQLATKNDRMMASPCYVVRLACAVAFVLPLVFTETFLMAASPACYRCLKNVEVSGKMTHNTFICTTNRPLKKLN